MRVKTFSLVIATAALALAAGYFAGQRWPAVSRSVERPAFEHVQSLPDIPPIQTSLRRLDLSRKPTAAETAGYIARAAETGVYRSSKAWEIIINSHEAA